MPGLLCVVQGSKCKISYQQCHLSIGGFLCYTQNTIEYMTVKQVTHQLLTDERFQLFKSKRHELEHVGRCKGVDYINDSASVNINSSWYALTSTNGPIIWIMGCNEQKPDYYPLFDQLHKVKAIICIGKYYTKVHKAFGNKISIIVNLDNIDLILSTAKLLAHEGDTVLFSPGCESSSFEDRGLNFIHSFQKNVL